MVFKLKKFGPILKTNGSCLIVEKTMHYALITLRQFALFVVILVGIATILASYHKQNEFPGDRAAASADFLRHVRTGSRVDLDARAS